MLCHFQQYFSYIVAVSFNGGGNQNARRKPPTCCKSLAVFKVLPLVKLKPTISYNWLPLVAISHQRQPFAAFICNETLNGYWQYMVANLPMVTICDIWFQNTVIGIPLFLIMADMNILVRAICSSIQSQEPTTTCFGF